MHRDGVHLSATSGMYKYYKLRSDGSRDEQALSLIMQIW